MDEITPSPSKYKHYNTPITGRFNSSSRSRSPRYQPPSPLKLKRYGEGLSIPHPSRSQFTHYSLFQNPHPLANPPKNSTNASLILLKIGPPPAHQPALVPKRYDRLTHLRPSLPPQPKTEQTHPCLRNHS